jgi:two-component system LytT family response regulator
MASDRKITVMIVDDEPLARHGLREIIGSEKDLMIVAEAADGEEALRSIAKHSPDVVFLDIQMPEVDGFDVISALPKKKIPLVVFVTAYDEFAVKAFESHALDYVLKPFDAERIRSALHRVREMIRLKTNAAYSVKILEALQSRHSPKKYIERIMVRNAGKISFVPVDEVLWIEAAADYIVLHTKNGKHTTREMIGSIEQQLDPSRFVRIHRSSIVNLSSIRELRPEHHGDMIALMIDGSKICVSRSYREKLQNIIDF